MRLSTVFPMLEQVAVEQGVARIGASRLDDDHVALFESWIAAGNHASMQYLERSAVIRRDPATRFPWARSALVILVPYAAERPRAGENALGRHVARYALGDDYHEVLDGILKRFEDALNRVDPAIRSWRYVDTGPLSDRSMAAQAGLGWIGRNGMLIDDTIGSWLFIGVLLTSLENDLQQAEVADRCGSCTRCVDACPTNAILPDRTIASSRCISYATIEHRGPLDPEVAAHLAGNAFGCDICQEVCPWNESPAEAHPAFLARASYGATPITDLLRYEQADFSSLFRRSAIKRAKLAGMQRNIEALLSDE